MSATADAAMECLHSGFDSTFSYMSKTFGFTQRETVAILGAHSLGLAECAPLATFCTAHYLSLI